MGRYEDIAKRIAQLGLSARELGMEVELYSLRDREARGKTDVAAFRLLDERLTNWEQSLGTSSFLEPRSSAHLSGGEVAFGTTSGGVLATLSFRPEASNSVNVVVVVGRIGTGKSSVLGLLAQGAARTGLYSLVISTNPSLACMDVMQDHESIDARYLELNPWQAPGDVDVGLWDQRATMVFSRSYELQYAERETDEVVARLRSRGVQPTPPLVKEELQKSQTREYSRRNTYKDSAILALEHSIRGCGGVLGGVGMPVSALLQGNRILRLPFPPRHSGFIRDLIVDQTWLMATDGQALDRRLVLGIDEAQAMKSNRELSEITLGLRHAGICLVACYQDARAVPPEVFGNADCIISFAATDYEDKRRIGDAMNMSKAQLQELPILGNREFVVFFPKTAWSRPFRAKALEVRQVVDGLQRMRDDSESFRQKYRSTREESADDQPTTQEERATDQNPRTDEALMRFLVEVTNRSFEFASLTERWERSGIRSASEQQRVMKKAEERGFVRRWRLAKGRGRPITLVEATNEGFRFAQVQPWKGRGRGNLATRAATKLLEESLQSKGFSVVREGSIE